MTNHCQIRLLTAIMRIKVKVIVVTSEAEGTAILALRAIPAAFVKLQISANSDALEMMMQNVQKHLGQQYHLPPNTWSFYGKAVRTNNDLEGWHNGLNRRAGGRVHIPFYILIQHFHKEAKLFEIQVRLVSDRKLQRIQRQTYRRLQTNIFELLYDYASKAISGEQLLKACS